MSRNATIDELLADLNPQQREAATHGDRPLLIVAGAGTGKTATLGASRRLADRPGRRSRPHPAADVHPPGGRRNAPPGGKPAPPPGRPGTTRVWGGTYHAIATRLLHRYGKAVGLPPRVHASTTAPIRRTC